MAPEKLAFRVVVFYEAAALIPGSRVPPITVFLVRTGYHGRWAAAVFAGAWMFRHLRPEP